jgi:hypothetical protein
MTDFYHGAPIPDLEGRQVFGEYLPWLHNCGEIVCPFRDESLEDRQEAFQTRRPSANRPQVDHWAWPIPVHVKVRLDVLGVDPTIWGGLEMFSGVVTNRYYHETDGGPMFSVDFGGGIGTREVHVGDSEVDLSRQFAGVGDAAVDGGSGGSGVHAALTEAASDPEDGDWVAAWGDFSGTQPGTLSSSDEATSYIESPEEELGMYNPEKDLWEWTFGQIFADNQWQETHLELAQNTKNFSGPHSGPTQPPS